MKPCRTGTALSAACLLMLTAHDPVRPQPPPSTVAGGENYVSAVAANGDLVVAGTWGGGLLLSHDAESWEPVAGGAATSHLYDVVIRKSVVFAGTGGEGIHAYDLDAGRWAEDRHALAGRHIFCLGGDRHVLLAGTWRRGLFRSLDGGRTWSPSHRGLGRRVIYCIGAGGGALYVGTARGWVYRSRDRGETWRNIGPNRASVTSVAVLDDDAVLAGTWKRGTFRRAAGDTQWVSVGAPAEPVRDFVTVGGRVYAARRMAGVYASDDGVRWSPVALAGGDPYALGRWRHGLVVGTWGAGVAVIRAHDVSRGSPWRRWPQGTEVPGGTAREDPLLAGVENTGRIVSARTCHRGKLVLCYEVEHGGSLAIEVYTREGRMLVRKTVVSGSAGRHLLPLDVRAWEPGIYRIDMRTRRDVEAVYAVVIGVVNRSR